MAKMSRDPLGADVEVGGGDVTAFDFVEVAKTAEGLPVLLPRTAGARRLGGEKLEVLADVQAVARRIEEARERLDALVAEARDLGVPWSLIGFSVGTTGEAARQRWTDDA